MFDIAIIGSGPAAVSAAWPLVEAGHKVVMLEAASTQDHSVPTSDYFDWRRRDPDQSRYFSQNAPTQPASPKLSLSRHARARNEAERLYPTAHDNFFGGGYLAQGGMSQAWGAGVAAFDAQDMEGWPITVEDLRPHYASVAARIGISGHASDALANFFGDFYPLQKPLALDPLAQRLYGRRYNASDIQLGAPRHAVLTQPLKDRLACSLSGNCFYGCHRKSIYNAADEVTQLQQFANFTFIASFPVERFIEQPDGYSIIAPGKEPLLARKVILAAGTIGSTVIAHKSLKRAAASYALQSSPMAMFALLVWQRTYTRPQHFFALSQLSYRLPMQDEPYVFGNLFTTTGLPAGEILKTLPISMQSKSAMAKYILPFMLVGNCFFHSRYSAHKLQIDASGAMSLHGSHDQALQDILRRAKWTLRRAFAKRGAWLLPGSFSTLPPGSDYHYGGTLPHRLEPQTGETHPNGRIHGFRHAYCVDGAVLPQIPAKAHSFTIMANAQRIACLLRASHGKDS